MTDRATTGDTKKAGPVRLRDLAKFIRSKNAGPFILTIDLMFDDEQSYSRAVRSGAISPATIAELYRIDQSRITVFEVPEAYAIKVSFPRALAAGDVGDSDVAGGQQYAPIVDLLIH